ncbi:hypothetical protein MSS93_04005 [Deinococcus radiodurans]|nr:hypothetical protein MSS93_04005 [Deinococcus radiodurans]
MLIVILVVAFESAAVGTMMPRVATELRGLGLYGWASSAFMLANLLGAIVAGLLTDRRGRRGAQVWAWGCSASASGCWRWPRPCRLSSRREWWKGWESAGWRRCRSW